jgi:hypothetical protein
MNEMRYLSIMVHDFPMRILNINHHLLVNVSGMLIGYEWEHEKNNSIFMGWDHHMLTIPFYHLMTS